MIDLQKDGKVYWVYLSGWRLGLVIPDEKGLQASVFTASGRVGSKVSLRTLPKKDVDKDYDSKFRASLQRNLANLDTEVVANTVVIPNTEELLSDLIDD